MSDLVICKFKLNAKSIFQNPNSGPFEEMKSTADRLKKQKVADHVCVQCVCKESGPKDREVWKQCTVCNAKVQDQWMKCV